MLARAAVAARGCRAVLEPRQFCVRHFALSAGEVRERLMEFQDLFVEARLCMQDTHDSLDTTYFEEDLADAKVAVEAAVGAYKNLINELEGDERGEVDRANGMKVKQLEEEFKQIQEHYLHDH